MPAARTYAARGVDGAMQRRAESGPAPVVEVLHGTFVLLSRRARLERAEVAPFACLRILLARVEPIAAAAKLANHCWASSRCLARSTASDGPRPGSSTSSTGS